MGYRIMQVPTMDSMRESRFAGASEASHGIGIAGRGWQFRFGSEQIGTDGGVQLAVGPRVRVLAGADRRLDREVALANWASAPWSRCARLRSSERRRPELDYAVS